MAQLINSIADLKKHLTVSANFDFNKVLPYTKRAQRKFIESQIGHEQLQAICAHVIDENSQEPMDRVKFLLEEAAANYAFWLAVPFINLQITNFGIKTTETKQSEDASWKDIRDLKRNLLETANEAIDSALEIMEGSTSVFTIWRDSQYYTVFADFIVRHTQTFNQYFDIQNNRKTFISIKPYMYEVEEQYLLPMLGKCTLDFVKTTSIVPEVLRVQELLKMAVVALTVSKVALTGKFLFTATSFLIQTEEMPWEKSKLELTPENQEKLRCDRENAGLEYLKKVKSILVENPTIFDCYEDKVESGLTEKIITKKSHLFL
jgi:hypothetical protein